MPLKQGVLGFKPKKKMRGQGQKTLRNAAATQASASFMTAWQSGAAGGGGGG